MNIENRKQDYLLCLCFITIFYYVELS